MEKQVIRLNEEQLNQLIAESVIRVISESEDENLLNNLRAAWNGARRGYKAQQTVDRGTTGFKTQHDHDDVMKSMKNPLSKMENTAEEQCREIYNQYKEAYMEANRLLNLYNKMVKQYGLEKQGVGQYSDPNKTPASPVADVSGMTGQKGGGKFGRKFDAKDTRTIGHYGK